MGEVWIKEAEDLKPVGNSNPMSGIGGPRATLHCTVSNPGSFDAMHRVLTSKSSESHLLYDPKTDRLGQYFPLDRAARALARGTLAYSHNRVGSINIQIEVCAMPVDWTAGANWNPGPNFRAMMRAIRSWGIEPVQVAPFAQTSGENRRQSWATFSTTAGGGKWWGHCHIPDGESHWDPGRVNWSRFIAAAGYTTTTEEDDMFSDTDRARLKALLDDADGQTLRNDIAAVKAEVAALAAKVDAGAGTTILLDQGQLETALRNVLRDGINARPTDPPATV